MLYTSGTTGAPKGAVITDHNIASDLDMLARAWAWTGDDTVVHALPLFHVHGLVLGLFGSQRRGGALRWVARFTAADLAAAVGEQAAAGPTMLFAVPTMYHRLCEDAEQSAAIAGALRAARVLVSGSAPLPAREHQRLERVDRPPRDRALRPDRDAHHHVEPARRRAQARLRRSAAGRARAPARRRCAPADRRDGSAGDRRGGSARPTCSRAT